MYGTTSGGGTNGSGTVFSLDRKTHREKVVYSFCSQLNCVDGQNPGGTLIDVSGTLYGTTFWGGTGFQGQEYGTVFTVNPNTGVEKVVYSFCSQQNCADGANPTSLIHLRAMLYGTTETGGTSSYGTAFTLGIETGAENVLYSFCQQPNCSDGQNPDPALIDVKGVLYGTAGGGANTLCSGHGCGTVFSIYSKTGAEKVLYSFCSRQNCSDGANPAASVIDVNGLLYGTTSGGGVMGCGAFGCGTVFSFNPSTGVENVLYSFCSQENCADGANPIAGLVDINGVLYGTTNAGGTGCEGSGCGVVFSIDPAAGTENVLYAFCTQQRCTDGANPDANLVAVNGKLYGTTDTGGAYGYGTVFVLKKKN